MENQVLDSELYQSELNFTKASKSKRFANYLIDIVISVTFTLLIYMGLALMGFSFIYDNPILDRLVSAFLFSVYYIICESSLKGKTIGKFVTKTRAICEDGSTMDMSTVVKRSFSRVVPFEVFSFLGSSLNGWHDTWSKTIVIDETLSPEHVDI